MGCPVLDLFMSGGIPCGLITEFVGEPAQGAVHQRSVPARPPSPPSLSQRALCGAGESTAAKSQLCLQLLLHVQLAEEYGGLGGSAV